MQLRICVSLIVLAICITGIEMTALILGVDGKFLAPVLSVLGIISGWIAGKTIKSVI